MKPDTQLLEEEPTEQAATAEFFTSYRHFHNNEKHTTHGSVTLAICRNGDDIGVGCSVCSPKDNFCRRRGREIAEQNAGTLILEGCWDMVEDAGMSLAEVAFYAVRRGVTQLPPDAPFANRWHKALGVMAEYTGLNDYGLGDKF